MNYWICIVNRKNWEIIKEKNIWGVSERNKNIILKIKIGDKIVFYIIKEMVFAGIFEAKSETYIDQKILFEPIKKTKVELFPYRIQIAPIKIVGEPNKIKSIITDLEFIKNKRRWSGHFFGKAMINLLQNDYLLLNRIMRD